MKNSDKTNPSLLIDPDQLYEVDYTIDQAGKRHTGKQLVKGSDLTENQIKQIIDRVDLRALLMENEVIDPIAKAFKAYAIRYMQGDIPDNFTGLTDKYGNKIYNGDKINLTFGKAANSPNGERIRFENVEVMWHFGRLQWVVTGGNLLDQFASLGPETYVDAEYEKINPRRQA